MTARHFVAAALLAVILSNGCTPDTGTIRPNDNRVAAGTLKDGVLTLHLEARLAAWYPEGPGSNPVTVRVFAEEGRAPTVPGPLIRVASGTKVNVTVRNALDRPLTVGGLGEKRGLADSAVVAPAGVRSFAFTAGAPGTFFYSAHADPINPVFGLEPADLAIGGALVIDSVGTKANDRVFVINVWADIDSTSPMGMKRSTMSINGLSWPHTERIDLAQGDSSHWRVINISGIDHPMHLHGFYFRMDATGDGTTDSPRVGDARSMEVTHIIAPLHTMAFSWKAERPGNWVWHCHYASHISHLAALDNDRGSFDEKKSEHHTSEAPHQMFGLVMGIRVAARGAATTSTATPRSIRLLVNRKDSVYFKQPGYSFSLDTPGTESKSDSLIVPGPTLVLERGKPVAITVVNRTPEQAAVHWHGIELESYPDGVPGWSGAGKSILPPVPPHDSMTIRFTPPRTGTFMYHSHINEGQQINGGLYGPIVVVEPGEKYDPETDRTLFFTVAGFGTNPIFGPFPVSLMNGDSQPPPMNFRAGTKYRLRLLNLAGDAPTTISIERGKAPVQWRALAKDGYELPVSQATARPAKLFFEPGEIYDFEFTPTAGDLTLRFGGPQLPPGVKLPSPFAPIPPIVTVPVRVR